MKTLKSLFQILIYSMAAFGFAMLCAYLIVTFHPQDRSYIPTMAITQTLCYVAGITIAVILFLSDIVFKKMNDKFRTIGFFGILYVMGMIFFQINAPIGPFDRISHFFIFSIWILWMSLLCLVAWYLYQSSCNANYNYHLNEYKKHLDNKES